MVVSLDYKLSLVFKTHREGKYLTSFRWDFNSIGTKPTTIKKINKLNGKLSIPTTS